jgi:N-methylhydantoinase A/oxoprolinase/acetone carboxylase beta subunit
MSDDYSIGVDTGGTYTDVCVIDKTGRVTIGKAPTTPGQLDDGVMDALENAAQTLLLSGDHDRYKCPDQPPGREDRHDHDKGL